MKKIIIIDGGPRKNFNTAQLLQFGFENTFLISMNGVTPSISYHRPSPIPSAS